MEYLQNKWNTCIWRYLTPNQVLTNCFIWRTLNFVKWKWQFEFTRTSRIQPWFHVLKNFIQPHSDFWESNWSEYWMWNPHPNLAQHRQLNCQSGRPWERFLGFWEEKNIISSCICSMKIIKSPALQNCAIISFTIWLKVP